MGMIESRRRKGNREDEMIWMLITDSMDMISSSSELVIDRKPNMLPVMGCKDQMRLATELS